MHRIRVLGAVCMLTLLASLTISAPAQASPLTEQYEMVTSSGTALPGVFWVDQQQGIIGCTSCAHWFDIRTSPVLDPRSQSSVDYAILAGLTDLSDTTVTTDPTRIGALRSAALAQFTTSAHALGSAAPTSGLVGSYNPTTHVTTPISTPWLATADQDIVAGLNDLKTSFLGPEPDPWITAATAQFDAAFHAISDKQTTR